LTDDAIFVMGCGRSGTTLTFELLAGHDDLAWVPRGVHRFPRRLLLSSFARVYHLPGLGKRLLLNGPRTRYFVGPVEPWKFWHVYLEKFIWDREGPDLPRPPVGEDITDEEVRRIRAVVGRICRYMGRPRFLSKYADFPRMAYLKKAFPAARFVHVLRDGRAVAQSYLRKLQSGVFHDWRLREKWVAVWPDAWRRQWHREGESQLAFAATQWKFWLDTIWQEARQMPSDQYLEIRYEDLIADPRGTTKQILEFAGLPYTNRFRWLVEHWKFADMNRKWRSEFTGPQKEELDRVICEDRFRRLFEEDPRAPGRVGTREPTLMGAA